MKENNNSKIEGIRKPVNVLFTGLIREPELFKQSIIDLIGLRKEGLVDKIYLSTWIGEVEKYPKIHKFLTKNKVKIIRSTEPNPRGTLRSPTIWCQMKALEAGLSHVEKDKFVLKTRTDVYIDPRFLRKLFKEKENLLKITKSLPKGNIFRYKIWIFYYELKTPFHMGEECFFGQRNDLKNLINYEESYDTNYKIGGGISHIRRYIHPFLKMYPIFEVYLRKYAKDEFFKSLIEKEKIFFKSQLYAKYFPHRFGLRGFLREFGFLRRLNKSNKLKTLAKKLEGEEFLDILVAYYSILYSHFYVDNVSFKDQVKFYGKKSANVDVDPTDLDKNFSKEKIFASQAGGQIFAYDMEFLENICNKKIKKSPLSERLMQAIDRFNQQK